MAPETAPAANGGGRLPPMTAVAAPNGDDGFTSSSVEDEIQRPAQNVLSRSLRITLGGKEYVLAVLFIAGNERWRAYQEKRTAAFVDEMKASGTDWTAIREKFNEEPDVWLDLLYAYDTDGGRRAGVLPPREELKESIFEDEPEAAVAEVVKAANPKAVIGFEGMRLMAVPTMNGSSQPTNTSPRPTAGRPKRSAKH